MLVIAIGDSSVLADVRDGARLALVANTGHTFGAEHPFAGVTAALTEAMNITVAFFREKLRG